MNRAGKTPLSLTSNPEIIGDLILGGVNVTDVYLKLTSELQEERALKIMEYLTDHEKWDPTNKTMTGDSALHYACRAERPMLVHHLISKCKCNPSDKNRNRVTPLMLTYNFRIISDLILSGAESCLLYTSPSPRDATLSRMPSSA